MKLKTLLIDDEASARSRLKKLLAPHPDLEIIGEASDGLDAVQQISTRQPELIFLDVQMPGLNGFEVLQALPRDKPLPLVIFATAFDEHALAAFEANALGYLLKPINGERLQQSIERALTLAQNKSQAETEQQRLRSITQAAAHAAPLAQLVARKRDRFVLLRPDQVVFLRVEDGLVRLHTDTENYWTDYQLNDLEARLPAPPFFRAHRAVIVNLRKVKELAPFAKSTFLLLMHDRAATEIQVSERQAKKLRELLEL
jgi:DNA-binding LytR/AlgR family response regulator